MAVQDSKAPSVANVDFLVDENGSRIDVPPDSEIRPTGDTEAAVGATSPTNWWLYGVVGLAIVVALLFLMQMLNGAPGTDVQPGSPTSEPVVETPAQPAAQ
ncbi:hypothetical protein VW35_18135 [Devosia soli]|uniref:Uncharacterized protein n=1 Tax=Devosia soli TaxID=361041 RepID=A0A0F5L2U0_9HYPH|nr:hypothetical protein [Devosia soli]KKB76678.1 hypothetical protein VW35_18135 [Devosia soli]